MFGPSLRGQRDNEIVSVLTSAARTATGQSAAQIVGRQPETIAVFLNVTAVSGTTPSMTVSLECSVDGGTTWFTVKSGTAITAVGKQVLVAQLSDGVTPVYRLNYALSGTTPSFTFTATANVTAN